MLKSHRSKMGNTYVTMKTMQPPHYHHSDFVATHAQVQKFLGIPQFRIRAILGTNAFIGGLGQSLGPIWVKKWRKKSHF